jgi:hypothetical protein
MIPIIGGVIEKALGIADKFIPDKDARERLRAELEQAAQQGRFDNDLAQILLNTEEAKSPSLFKGGWRPAVGWVCAIAFGYSYVLYPFLKFIAVIAMDNPPEFPTINLGEMMPVLLGMLGLGYLRTDERKAGVIQQGK